jgi:hypothetical protein
VTWEAYNYDEETLEEAARDQEVAKDIQDSLIGETHHKEQDKRTDTRPGIEGHS